MPKEAKKRLRLHEGVPEQQHDDEDEDEEIERLGKTDAYMFPILGSVVLFCLYCAFTYLPKVWINRIIGGYMGLMSIGAAARMAVTAVQTCMSEKSWRGISVVS